MKGVIVFQFRLLTWATFSKPCLHWRLQSAKPLPALYINPKPATLILQKLLNACFPLFSALPCRMSSSSVRGWKATVRRGRQQL